MFKKMRAETKAITLSPSFVRVYELLNGLDIERVDSQKRTKPGVVSFLKKVFSHAHDWAGSDSAAVVAVVVAVAVVEVVAVVVAVVAVAVVVAAVVVAAAAVAAAGGAVYNKTAFYALLAGCVILTIIASFAAFSVFPPLVAALVMLGCYFLNGIKSAVRIKPKTESLPTTAPELHRFVKQRIEETIKKYRSRALNADSEFAKRLTDAEKNLENIQTLIARMKGMLAAGEDKEYILPR